MNVINTAAQTLSALPLCHPAQVIGERDVLVIAPHPDDESLGCGGLLAWAADTRRLPRVLFLTNGELSHSGSVAYPPDRLGELRRSEALAACTALGVHEDDVTFLGLPDSGLASLNPEDTRSAIRFIHDWIAKSPSAAVCVTAKTDGHSDHMAAHKLASEAVRGSHRYRLFAYPIWTWLQDDSGESASYQGWRIDISAYHSKKRYALACHASQQGRVVTDASGAFALPSELMERANQDYEVLLDAYL